MFIKNIFNRTPSNEVCNNFINRIKNKYNNNITVSQYIIERLIEKKINKAFGYNGGAALPFFDSIYKFKDFEVIISRHEQASGHAAQAYSKVTNNLGVLLTTSGPGFTNVITPLQDAFSDGHSLLCISGQVSSSVLGTDAFQECDATGISKSCVKDSIKIVHEINFPNLLEYAINLAEYPRKGPVHLDICKDIFNRTVELDNIILSKGKYIDNDSSVDNKFYNLLSKINQSKKPVLIAGVGANDSFNEMRKFINKYNIPCATTLHGLGIIDEYSDLSLKMIGMHGSYYGNKALEEADLIIGIGNRFDDRTVGKLDEFGVNARKNFGIVHIDNSHDQSWKVSDVLSPNLSICCSAKKLLNHMNKLNVKHNPRNEWLSQIKQWKTEFKLPDSDNLTGNYIIEKLSEELRDNNNYLLTTGVGSHQMVAAQYFNHKLPNRFLTSGSLGTMGAGMPFAVGAQIANPELDVFLIDGDGSFTMSLNDMATIVEYNLPIKMFVFNDQKLKMVNLWQELFYEKRIIGSQFKYTPEFNKIADAYNIKSFVTNNKSDVKNIIKETIAHKGPVLVNWNIETSYCLPFVPPNTRLGNMITSH